VGERSSLACCGADRCSALQLVRKLGAALDEKNKEVAAWQEKYKIRITREARAR
jgi:hypothetical protein